MPDFQPPDFQPPTKALKDLGLTGFKLTFLLALVIICVGGNALKLLHEFANVIRAIFGTAGYVFSPHTMIALFSSAAVVLVVTRMLDTSRHNNKENANAKIKVRKAETERELALAHVNAQKNKDNLSAGIQKNRDNLSAGIQKHRDGRNAALQRQRDRLVSQEPPYPFMRQNHASTVHEAESWTSTVHDAERTSAIYVAESRTSAIHVAESWTSAPHDAKLWVFAVHEASFPRRPAICEHHGTYDLRP